MRPETILQRAIRARLTARGLVSVHVPNGATLSGDGKQRAIQMANLKKDGLLPGMADLLVYGQHGRMGHIECKCEGEKQTDTQVECERWLTAWGHKYAVCRSQDDVDETLREWGWL